jgi:predicted dehydrogenase
MKRRSFLKSAAAAASLSIVPRHVLGGNGNVPPSERLNLASIGLGNMGANDIGSFANGPINMVGLCDVHEGNLANASARFRAAKTFTDFRKMLDSLDKQIDAVSVATPDHMHVSISMSAIRRGKHVYCQKPLTHSLYEARQIAAAARKAGVVTQMGIQIHSSIEYRMATAIIQAGAIGRIKEVHTWSNRPSWPQGGGRPAGSSPVPKELDWDLWLGVAPERPFVAGAYVPIVWRGFLDFGNGALGDMGCHIIDPPYASLKLTSSTSVLADGPGCTKEMFPNWETIHYEFPGTEYTAGKTLMLHWHDGRRPKDGSVSGESIANKPAESLVPLDKDQHLPEEGSIFIGESGSILLPHVGGPQLLPREKFLDYKRPKLAGHDHYVQWVKACLGQDKASAGFDFSGPLTETVLLGVLAARFPGKKLEWDAANLRVTNLPEANEHVRVAYRKGWEMEGL